ncbi:MULTISPECIES: hypothetical protein [Pseudoalteromonas]|uniref:Uncharacterized protein n=1 Tax=Pseudoalteromonas galatheae TaxID=579562 RepID=A0A8T6YQE7_9GAMM|nr:MULTISPECIES: hypothetical protein [Pseudoalteromonas]NKC19027.1 hypothetical protein [Pseudoalteromonas galatheae]
MKLKIKKKSILNLSDKKSLNQKLTPQVGGGGFTSSWFEELSKAYCDIAK